MRFLYFSGSKEIWKDLLVSGTAQKEEPKFNVSMLLFLGVDRLFTSRYPLIGLKEACNQAGS